MTRDIFSALAERIKFLERDMGELSFRSEESESAPSFAMTYVSPYGYETGMNMIY
jgi:hypothetical protein